MWAQYADLDGCQNQLRRLDRICCKAASHKDVTRALPPWVQVQLDRDCKDRPSPAEHTACTFVQGAGPRLLRPTWPGLAG